MASPRILGGSARGRALHVPRHGTRPSPSRLREALFNVLAFRPVGHFLDLFAGSGALGLEAASRGWRATCVDLSAEACQVIGRNARELGLSVTVRRADALAVAQALKGEVDVCSAAPPYPLDLPAIFGALLRSGCVRPGGCYVFQHPTGMDLGLDTTGLRLDQRRYGSNALSWLWVDEQPVPEPQEV